MSEEHKFQEAAFVFTCKALPGVPVYSIDCGWPNDGSQRAQNMLMARKRRGIQPGLPDLWVILPRIITFETKRLKGGHLSDAQLARRQELLDQGHHWFGPITTLEQIEAALLSLDLKLACRTGAKGVAIPVIGKRRMANYNRLNDPLPF